MSWNIQKPGDYINGPLTVAGVTQFNSNIAVGITPNTWSSLWKGGQFGRLTLVNTSTDSLVGHNFYNDGSYRFVANDFASYYDQVGGGHIWGSSVTSGIAGNVITWTTLATLSSAGFGLGVTPAYAFHLRSANAPIAMIHSTNASGPYVIFQNSTGNFGDIGSELAITGGGSAGNLALNARTTGSLAFCISDSVKARLLLGGAFVLSGGNSSANGTGITFPSAQSASTDANTLDDYEEGTWTGTLRGLTSDPTVTVTATGQYTKIGRKVTVRISFEGVTNTGASGDCFINGLPFANGNVRTPGSAGSYAAMTYTGTLISLIDGSSTNINFIDSRSNAAWAGAAHYPGSGRTICAEVTYNV